MYIPPLATIYYKLISIAVTLRTQYILNFISLISIGSIKSHSWFECTKYKVQKSTLSFKFLWFWPIFLDVFPFFQLLKFYFIISSKLCTGRTLAVGLIVSGFEFQYIFSLFSLIFKTRDLQNEVTVTLIQ